jgi:hypothetical protein
MQKFMLTVVAVGAFALMATAVQAFPKYATKEKKACIYCHLKASGGDLNPRGAYYAEHDHSFKDYDEEKVMGGKAEAPKKTGPPAFKLAWKADLPGATRRIAVADVTGDKKPRLLALGEAGALTIYKMATDAVEKEASLDLGANAVKFVAGRFAKGKPAIIAVPGALFYRDGENYTKKDAPDLKDINGRIKFTSGAEYAFFYQGGPPDVYGIDLTAANPVTAGEELVMPQDAAGKYSDAILRGTPEMLAELGVPEQGQKAGIIGIFDPRGDKNLYYWVVWQEGSVTTLSVVNVQDVVGGAPKPVWTSPALTGKVLDVATGLDPKEGKVPGLYVLQAVGAESKDRLVQFFALD